MGLQVGQDKTLYGAQNARGLLFFEGLFLAFRCLFSSLFVFPQEHKMMVRASRSHPQAARLRSAGWHCFVWLYLACLLARCSQCLAKALFL